jgi:protein-tyrosine phosphatase
MLIEHDIKNIIVDSCAIENYHTGEKADSRMRAIAKKRGYTIRSIARQFDPETDFAESDAILIMDQGHYDKIKQQDSRQQYSDKIHYTTDYCQHYQMDHVPDPYYGESDDFQQVIDILEDACSGLIETLNTEKDCLE